MLMWEVLVGIPALAGLSAARVHSYTSRGLRPQFPPNTPDHYRGLAHACWAQDPRRRPTAGALVVALHKVGRGPGCWVRAGVGCRTQGRKEGANAREGCNVCGCASLRGGKEKGGCTVREWIVRGYSA